MVYCHIAKQPPSTSKNPEIRISTAALDCARVRITIANTGSTIPERIQQRIFEPFFTTKPVGRGTGLGLFVSYSIIQKHGGILTVRSRQRAGGISQPGAVTEFEIVLPLECG